MTVFGHNLWPWFAGKIHNFWEFYSQICLSQLLKRLYGNFDAHSMNFKTCPYLACFYPFLPKYSKTRPPHPDQHPDSESTPKNTLEKVYFINSLEKGHLPHHWPSGLQRIVYFANVEKSGDVRSDVIIWTPNFVTYLWIM
jgi:hypothetical protein